MSFTRANIDHVHTVLNKLTSFLPIDDEKRYLLTKLWREKWLFMLAIACAFAAALFEAVGLGLIIPFLQSLTDPAGEPFRTNVQWIDTLLGVEHDAVNRLYRVSALILGAAWLRAGLTYCSNILSAEIKERVLTQLRSDILDQIQAVSLGFFASVRPGDIISNLTNEIQRVRFLLGIIFVEIVRGSVLVVYIAAILWISWQLSLIALISLGLLSLSLVHVTRWVKRSGRRVSKANARLTSTASEIINGVRTIAAFNTQTFEKNRFMEASDEVADQVVETARRQAVIIPLMHGGVVTILIGMIVVATQFFVLRGTLDAVMVLAFLFALFRLLPIVQEINQARGNWASFSPALQSIAEFLHRADKPYLTEGERTSVAFNDRISLRGVTYEYEPGSPVLKGITLDFPKASTTAIVGASGAGKSTLVDLVPRFDDPTDGQVLIDGIDIREFRLTALRDKIGIVSQDTFLINDSIAANIAYGLPDTSMDRIVEAADQANALDFILDMKDGFNTNLGDRGIRLSGGQKQRIAIARAILRDPEILILDEATSALDSVSERMVQASLEKLVRDRTVIVIAHRLSTVENADQVVVLEEGKVVERGTYEELLERKGYLWEYHSIQFQLS